MEVAKELVKTVSRSFYEDKYSVLLDFLLRERMLPDDVLAERMHVLIKDVNRMAARLREDRLLHMQVRQEMRPYDGRQINRTYYYVDLAHFVDVTSYRLFRMRRTLEEQATIQAAERAYSCATCKRQYGLFDVPRLLNPLTQAFECEVCHNELQSVDGGTNVGGFPAENSAMLATSLTEQTHEILWLLRRLEGITLPPFDPIEYLKHCEAFDLVSEDATGLGVEESNYSSSDSGKLKKGSKELEVELVAPATSTGTKAIVHELPSWHTHSTVTGIQIKPALAVDTIGGKGTEALDTTSMSVKTTPIPGPDLDYQSYYEEQVKRPKADARSGHQEPGSGAITTTTTTTTTTGAVIAGAPSANAAESATTSVPSRAAVTVTVQGEPKDIRNITAEDKERMTEEEYINYYQAYENL